MRLRARRLRILKGELVVSVCHGIIDQTVSADMIGFRRFQSAPSFSLVHVSN